MPDREVDRMCRILLTQLLPAIAENNLLLFCESVEAYQGLGFKKAEIRTQTKTVCSAMNFMKENGGQGAGMSSWGPAIFAFGTELTALRTKMQGWLQAQGGGEVFVTNADNTGHRMLL